MYSSFPSPMETQPPQAFHSQHVCLSMANIYLISSNYIYLFMIKYMLIHIKQHTVHEGGFQKHWYSNLKYRVSSLLFLLHDNYTAVLFLNHWCTWGRTFGRIRKFIEKAWEGATQRKSAPFVIFVHTLRSIYIRYQLNCLSNRWVCDW